MHQRKVRLIQPRGKVVLDTCGGLGYFAAWCLQGKAKQVLSYEKNPDVFWLRTVNPWSPVAGGPLSLNAGDVVDEITRLASNSVDAVNKVLNGTVDAAIIPSPLVGSYSNLNSVISTDPVPHMALSASPEIPDEVALAVKQALLDAPGTPEGKKMLAEMKIEYFEDANEELYAGYAELLDGVFGY